MDYDEQLTARLPGDLLSDVDAVAERYGYDRSEAVRVLLRNGVDVVERDGLDALMEHSGRGDETAVAES